MDNIDSSVSNFVPRETRVVDSGEVRAGTGSPRNDAIAVLTVRVPLHAEIVSIDAYVKNTAWPDGEDWPDQEWHHAKFGIEPMGWCRVDGPIKTFPDQTQCITAHLHNWSHVKPRLGKLFVEYRL